MDIRITPKAHGDIADIAMYIRKDGESIAVNQVMRIYQSIEDLTNFPYIGASLQKFVERSTSLRYLVIDKTYIVIYEVNNDFVDIIRIFRKSQDFITVLGL